MFDKYNHIEIIGSKYYYSDCDVLKNKLGIRDENQLSHIEADLSQIRLLELFDNPIKGHFSKSHFLYIHKYIFQDLYKFAGRYRYEEIRKGMTSFEPCISIEKSLIKVFSDLKNENYLIGMADEIFISRLAYYMSELNIIHPFREGNGRTIREFSRELALKSDRIIDWKYTESSKLLNAAINSVDFDYSLLEECIREVLR